MKDKFSLEWILDKYSWFFESIKIPDRLVQDKYSDYFKSQPNGNGKDFLWSLFQFLIIETSETSNNMQEIYRIHERIYYEMASFRRKHEKIRANEILRLGFDSYLQGCEPSRFFIEKVEIISGGCCEYCDSLNGKRMDLEVARKNRYLASEQCTREYGCNCCYGYSAERDSDGNLIINEEN